MTNKRKKKSRPASRPSGYRDPKPAAAPARRRGLLDTMFAPGTKGSTTMPRVRTALTRGVVTVLGSPVILIAPIVFLLLVWLVLIAIGYQGPFAPLANLLALPPVGTSVDGSLATGLFGLRGASWPSSGSWPSVPSSWRSSRRPSSRRSRTDASRSRASGERSARCP